MESSPSTHCPGIDDNDNSDNCIVDGEIFSDEEISVIAKRTESFQISDTTLAAEVEEEKINATINNRRKNRLLMFNGHMSDYEIAFDNLLTHFMYPFAEVQVLDIDESKKYLQLETIYANTEAFHKFISDRIDTPIMLLTKRRPEMDCVYQLRYEQLRERWQFRLKKVLSFMRGMLNIGVSHVSGIKVQSYTDVFRPASPATEVTVNQTNTPIVQKESSNITQKSTSDISAIYIKMESDIKTSVDHNVTAAAVVQSFERRMHAPLRKPLPLIGIQNSNLNCCITSIIQCLFRLKNFRYHILEESSVTDGESLMAGFSKLYHRYLSATSGSKALDCSDIVKV